MRRFLHRWCWACTAFGVGLMLMGATAAAQGSQGQQGAFGFDGRDIILALLGLVMALVSAFIAGQRTSIYDLTKAQLEQAKRLTELEKELLRSYHTKDDLADRFKEQERAIDAVHRRLDRVGFPTAPPSKEDPR